MQGAGGRGCRSCSFCSHAGSSMLACHDFAQMHAVAWQRATAQVSVVFPELSARGGTAFRRQRAVKKTVVRCFWIVIIIHASQAVLYRARHVPCSARRAPGSHASRRDAGCRGTGVPIVLLLQPFKQQEVCSHAMHTCMHAVAWRRGPATCAVVCRFVFPELSARGGAAFRRQRAVKKTVVRC